MTHFLIMDYNELMYRVQRIDEINELEWGKVRVASRINVLIIRCFR
jgi:hypothetical protein